MFISVRSIGSGAWSGPSPQESQQSPLTIHQQRSEVLPQQHHDRQSGRQTQVPLPASYISRPSGTQHPDPVNPAIKVDERGRRHISDGTNSYAIRYDRDNRTERVYQPQDPTRPGIPVRQSEHGDYVRHDEVGLKGGSRGRELRAQLDRAQGALNQAMADRVRATYDLARANEDIRPTPNPGTDLQTRRAQAQRNLDRAKMTIAIEQGRIEAMRLEAQLLRQTMQTELTHLRGHREDGTQLERVTQQEIAVLDTAMRLSDQPSADSQQRQQKLQDDLRRIQHANGTLDNRIMSLHREMDDIPPA